MGATDKRALDIALSGFGLLASSPLWAIFAALIKLEDGGPIFYRQERVGQWGRPFDALKFRSMRVEAEALTGAIQATAHDPRVTRIGRVMRATAMDELPQLLNIFRGDMSFVGPRALRPGEIESAGGRLVRLEDVPGFDQRITVPPGLTGIAQIYAPRDVPRRQKFRYDRLYIAKRSWMLDVRLILLSFWISLHGTWEARGKKYESTQSPVHDVVVIGGGPAGLMAARSLAGAGHDVVVLEEHASIGVPVHCTGLLGLEAFGELGLSRLSVLGTANAARFIAADGSSVFVDSDRIGAAIVDRAVFDAQLADESRQAGADVRPGSRVRSIVVADDRVVVEGDGGAAHVEARACVLACGASYRLNRALGLGIPRAFVQSAQLEVPFEGPDHVQVHLGRTVAPGGFAWVVPFSRGERRFNRVGLMCDGPAAPRFDEFASSLRFGYALEPNAWDRPRTKILPLGPVAKTFGRRLVAVGDAAGLVKPTTGGGIYYSLISGTIAADVLDSALAADDLSEARLREYELRWRERLGAEIRIGLAFRTLATRFNDRAIDALVELARVDGLVPLLKQTADFNWHSRSALALLRHAQFRKILLGSIWS